MAVKARDQVTISIGVDVASVDTYYKLQASTASVPQKPTTASPSGWSTTEPGYDGTTTNTLYTCQKTTLTDGTFYWGAVSKSSSYEAAKQAANGVTSLSQTVTTLSNNYATFRQETEAFESTVGTTYAKKLEIDELVSRGEQLVINGSLFMGDNTNFPPELVFDGSMANGTKGSVTRASGSSAIDVKMVDWFPIDANGDYYCSLDVIRDNSGNGKAYLFVYMTYRDVDKKNISYCNWHSVKTNGDTLTQLAQDLKSGDTKIYLNDVSKYVAGSDTAIGNQLIVWDWVNTFGYAWPPNTYSRHFAGSWAQNDSSVFNLSENSITLTSAYSGATIPSGTWVSQRQDGGTYQYFCNGFVPDTWTTWGHIVGASYTDGSKYAIPCAAAEALVGFLWNHTTGGATADQAQMWVTNISVTKMGAINDKLNTEISQRKAQFGVCNTIAGTAAKIVTVANFSLYTGAQIAVRFTNGNTVGSPTLNVNNTGAKSIVVNGSATPAAKYVAWNTYANCTFVYDGTYWRFTGSDQDMVKTVDVESRVSTAETSITQNRDNIALKANASDVYTKTAVDGKITQEVSDRNAAITTKANEINLSVSQTYSTKTEISDAKTYVANAKANYGYQYKKDIVIYGESSKYYPVYFTNVSNIPQSVTHDIMIRREYNEQAPSDWYSSTHKGGLNIHFGWNFGGWGGITYKCEVYEFTQMYSTMVGDILVGADNGIFSIVYLRGGGTTGALYHIYSDVPFTRNGYMANAGVIGENDVPYVGLEQGVKYAQNIAGDNPPYKWNVRAPLTEPNTTHLNEMYTVNRTALIESRVSTAETTIAQHDNSIALKADAENVYTKEHADALLEVKANKATLTSEINASADTATINANRVNIEGAAIFTNGRLTDTNIAKTANSISDTRSTNQPPSWYFTNYPKQSITEFKQCSVLGLSGEMYCCLTTVTQWADHSGGYPKQTAQVGSKFYYRTGISDNAWGDWSDTESTANEAYEKITSRGEQLVVNGNGFLGNNTNFSMLTFDGSVANGSPGSFTRADTVYANVRSDEFFPIDPSKNYKVEFDVISKGTGSASKMYGMLLFYDVDKLNIAVQMCSYIVGSTTTLARELKNGDTKVYLTDASGFIDTNASHQRALIFWDYTNSFGYTYPSETYSRNYVDATDGLWSDYSKIDKTNNIITLTSAWTGGTHAAGTSVSQNSAGSTYSYYWQNLDMASDEWIHVSGVYKGYQPAGISNQPSKFYRGTAYCRLGWLWNYSGSTSNPQKRLWITNISVKEDVATSAELATTTANAVKRTQRIYYRKNSAGAPSTPGTASANWVTNGNSGTWTKYNAWSTRVPPIADSVSSSTKYLYLYTCEQREMGNGTVAYTAVLLDDSITVIDGGNIITGSVTANKLNASDINASKSLTVGAMTDAAASTILNSNVQVGGRNYITGSATMDPAMWRVETYVTVSDGVATLNGTTADWSACLGSSLIDATLFDDDYIRVSFEYKASVDTVVYVDIDGSSIAPGQKNTGIRTKYRTSSYTFAAKSEWTRFEWPVILKIPSGLTTGSGDVMSIYACIWNRTDNSVLQVRHFKLEKGNKATDWTPAPEDVDASVEAAAKTATNYISVDSTGIRIADSNPATATTYQHQTATNTEFVVSNASVASFGGDGVRIGKSSESHMELDYHSMSMTDSGGTEYLRVSDLRDRTGYATVKHPFYGDGTTRDFAVSMPATSTESVTVDGVAASYTYSNQTYRLTTAPADGALVLITYKTNVSWAKAFTFGTRNSDTDPATGESYSAIGPYSAAFGSECIADGYCSFAAGRDSYAHGQSSVALGGAARAYDGAFAAVGGKADHGSVAFGGDATGGTCFAACSAYNEAKGLASSVFGHGAIASGDYQTALGAWNEEDTNGDFAFIVGNGTDDSNRSNAFTVDWDGIIKAGLKSGTISIDTRAIRSTSVNKIHSNGVCCSVTVNVRNNAAITNGSNIVVGTVPEEFCPPQTIYSACSASNAAGMGCYMTLGTAGAITCYNRSGSSVAANTALATTFTYAI